MGGLCAGGLPGVPSVPEIDIDLEALANTIKELLEEIPPKVQENLDNFPDEIRKADPNPFEVPDTNLTLTKDSTDDDISVAAMTSAFASTARDKIKDACWEQIEPSIDEQLNQVAGLPQALKDKAKEKAKEKTVDVAVDKACDEALEKMKESKKSGGDAAAAGGGYEAKDGN